MKPMIYACAITGYERVIDFTIHKSRFNAEKHYGDLSRRYRGSDRSDYIFTNYDSKEAFEAELKSDYLIDYKERTLTVKTVPMNEGTMKPIKDNKDKSSLINFRVSPKEREGIERNAKLYTKGNVSRWLRHIGAKPYERKDSK